MRAEFIIKHADIGLVGNPAVRLVDALARTCGNRIADHQQALAETLAFKDVVAAVAPSVVFAFRPTNFAIAICSRSSPGQLDVHLESKRSDIWSVSAAVLQRVSGALPPGGIKYEITLLEDDGKETGIHGKRATIASILKEQVQELRIVPLIFTVAGAFIAALIFGKNAVVSATSSGFGLAMLLLLIVVSCVYQRLRNRTAIKWKFEEI